MHVHIDCLPVKINKRRNLVMLRYQLFLSAAAVFVAVWWAALQSFPDETMVQLGPVWAILLLGIYAVGSIAIGLMNFKDFPEAAAEIDRNVIEAKAEMKRRKIIADDQ